MIYVALNARGGRAEVVGMLDGPDGLDDADAIIGIPSEAVPALIMARDGDDPIVGWLIEHGVVGADLVEAKRALAHALRQHIGMGL